MKIPPSVSRETISPVIRLFTSGVIMSFEAVQIGGNQRWDG